MLKTILVPVDGSHFAEQALEVAVELAKKTHATFRLIHVHAPAGSGGSGSELYADVTLDAALRESEHAYLTELGRRLEGRLPEPVITRLLYGPVVGAIHDHATGVAADLIVLSTHGRGPLARFWLGSVTDGLIRSTTIPLLLVRPAEPPAAAPAAIRWVLVPLDGSELAETVLEPAVDLAQTLGASVRLLRAVEPVALPDRRLGGVAAGGFDAVLEDQVSKEAEKYLEGVAGRLRSRGLSVETCVVMNRPVPAAILETAQPPGETLIALATHGRGGLARLLLGSVADKVIRGAAGPVLAYRPPPPKPKGKP